MEDKLVFDSQPALGGGGTLVLWGALGVLRRFSCLVIGGLWRIVNTLKATPPLRRLVSTRHTSLELCSRYLMLGELCCSQIVYSCTTGIVLTCLHYCDSMRVDYCNSFIERNDCYVNETV